VMFPGFRGVQEIRGGSVDIAPAFDDTRPGKIGACDLSVGRGGAWRGWERVARAGVLVRLVCGLTGDFDGFALV